MDALIPQFADVIAFFTAFFEYVPSWIKFVIGLALTVAIIFIAFKLFLKLIT